MEKTNDIQPTPEDLAATPASVLAHLERMQKEMSMMAEEIRVLRAKKFAPSSEKAKHISGQQFLFNEAEYLLDKSAFEPVLEEVVLRKKKKKGKREVDLTGLLTRRIDYELAPEECVCPKCAGALHEMSVDIRRELEYIPASYTVIEHVIHVYSCRDCDKHTESTPIVRAPSPAPIFKGSLASASLIAQVICDKYLYHLPLYRQEYAFAHDGINLTRQTLSNWVVKANEQWLTVIDARIRKEIVKRDVLHADESPLQVLREDNRPATAKSYMWLYRTGGDATHPLVLYDYQPSRAHTCPKDFLEEFTGYLHTDGYDGYHCLPDNIVVVGCWAHARRRFDEALTAMPVKGRAGSMAERGLDYINALYSLERSFAKLTADERYAARQEKSMPLANELFEWATNAGALPESYAGKAIRYLIEQREYLMNVFLDGRLEFDNNRGERSIKSYVMGRKAWLFSNTPNGAKASAAIFSIVETAKENKLRVYDYLKYLFEQLPNITTSQIDDMLPWSDKLPDHVKVPTAY